MSNLNHGHSEAHPLPAHKPASGLFFLCTLLLLIGIPASSYVEIWAGACITGDTSRHVQIEAGGMTVQPYLPGTQRQPPVRLPVPLKSVGKEIAAMP